MATDAPGPPPSLADGLADAAQVAVQLDEVGATLRPPVAAPFRLHLAAIALRLLWTRGDGDTAPRGHAYLLDRGSGPLELLTLQHGRVRHADMMALLARVDALLPPTDALARLRRSTTWTAPGPLRWCFTGDAGALAERLGARSLVVRHEQEPAEPRLPDELPQGFLADPIGTLVRAELPEVRWPAEWNANVLRPAVHTARDGHQVVVSACRYGSIHADAGQDRTAAMFCARDDGHGFVELPWRLCAAQAASPAGRFSWPPEQIDRIDLADGRLAVEWQDPWIDWEPGDEWRATWDDAAEHWVMRTR
jgi:hypothetical protein